MQKKLVTRGHKYTILTIDGAADFTVTVMLSLSVFTGEVPYSSDFRGYYTVDAKFFIDGGPKFENLDTRAPSWRRHSRYDIHVDGDTIAHCV